MRIRGWGASDVGRKREHNEDSFLCNDVLALYAVADGMGGHLGGERASRMAVDLMEQALRDAISARESSATEFPGAGAAGPSAPLGGSMTKMLRNAVIEADRAIYADALADPAVAGIGRYSLGGFQQLSGYQPGQINGNYLAFGRLTYYKRRENSPVFARGLFFGASLEAGNAWNARGDAKLNDLRSGSSVFLGADTGLGPVYLGLTYAPRGSTGVYLFVGKP